MKTALLLTPVCERMANIWLVAADTGFVALPVNFQQFQNNVGIIKKSRSQWNAVISH